MSWQRLVTEVGAEDLEHAESLLMLAGAQAIDLSEADGTEIFEPEPGQTPVWQSVSIRALFPASIDLPGLQPMLSQALPTMGDISISEVAAADWESALSEEILPLTFGGRLRLVPAGANVEPPAPDGIDVRLNMGLAFGTGRHPTTSLCLQWLQRQAGAGMHVLDYGAGSGILAVAALMLGAEFAYATDNDPQALEATRRNAQLNNVDDRLWSGLPEELPRKRVDIIVANILAGTLQALASEFAERIAGGGQLAMSGILNDQADAVRESCEPWFENFEQTELEGWTILSARRIAPDIL